VTLEIDVTGLTKSIGDLTARTSSLSTRVARFDVTLEKLFDRAEKKTEKLDTELKAVSERVATIEGRLSNG
jgi:hypothetical protein